MTTKELKVQKALGTVKKYNVPVVISVPFTTTIDVLVTAEVDALSIEDAQQAAVDKLKAMAKTKLKKLVAEAGNDSNFIDMNQFDMSDLFDDLTGADPKVYEYNAETFDPEEVTEEDN